MQRRKVVRMGLGLLTAAWLLGGGAAQALDPRNTDYEFKYSLYPPGGFSTKKSKAIARPDPKQPKAFAIIGANGKFTPFAQWFWALGSDPKSFTAWWHGYFTDPSVWQPGKTPVYEGDMAGNQGHRIIAWLGTFKQLVDADKEIDPAIKQALMSEAWKCAAEKAIGTTINPQGLLEWGGHKADMACLFHFVRSKFGSLGLKLDNLYTLDRAQNLMCTLLTEPWIVSAEDRWLVPPSPDYLEALGKQKGGKTGDIRLVKDGKILYPGGMFIGWKDKPALHGTWDGLSLINSLFKYYPEPDPQSAKSIFFKWNQLSEEQKAPGKKMIALCSRRLWLDWQEHKGPTWCWVHDGQPVGDTSRLSEAPFLPAHDGYGDEQLGWAKLCWEEMFGNPSRNTNDGVQALLAIAHGKVHRDLKKPTGEQLPGRYNFSADAQKAHDEDEPKSGGTKIKSDAE
jgi:hypothetical protein